MNEPWKRLIEAERRVMRLESLLQRQNTQIVSVAGAIQNDGRNPSNPFGSGGGGGTSGIIRFPISYEMWVEWDTVPTLKTGASLNPTADVTGLANAVSELESGFTLDSTSGLNGESYFFGFERNREMMAQFGDYDFRPGWVEPGTSFNSAEAYFKFAAFSDGQWLADAEVVGSGAYENLGDVFYAAEDTATQAIRIEIGWARRNGIGAHIDDDILIARRTLASADDFSYGPTYGESGTWSFAMECPANTYHNAGSGTIFLRWGTAAASIVSGGSPATLPSDIVDGGTPADLPTDIIDGGTI